MKYPGRKKLAGFLLFILFSYPYLAGAQTELKGEIFIILELKEEICMLQLIKEICIILMVEIYMVLLEEIYIMLMGMVEEEIFIQQEKLDFILFKWE